MQQNHEYITVITRNYAWDVMGIDPIGASDILFDWTLFVQNLVEVNEYTNPVDAWNRFNTEMLQPVYQLNLPARPMPDHV